MRQYKMEIKTKKPVPLSLDLKTMSEHNIATLTWGNSITLYCQTRIKWRASWIQRKFKNELRGLGYID